MSLSPGLLIPSMYRISSVWRHENEFISGPPHSQYVPYKFCVEAWE